MKCVTIGQLTSALKQINQNGKSWNLILIGLPGCGKSTLVNALTALKDAPFTTPFVGTFIASTDNLIESIAEQKQCSYTEAFEKHINMKQLKQKMLIGIKERANADGINNIIVDQTNMGRKSRAEKITLTPDHVKVALCFEVPEDKLKARLAARAVATGKFIPPHVLTSMLGNYQTPTNAEGFSYIWEFKE